jgi:alkylation response protein AidB-like acyl-CoA dehydrogenase
MGSEEQNERLATAIAGGRTWTFLAITEPDAGSDATRLRTELRTDATGGYELYGTKRYIGNGSRGTFGVVLARTGPSPLSLRAVLVKAPAPQLRAHALDMVGLRGARISELTFDGLPVEPGDLLGGHLSKLRRGMWGVIQAFNTVRVQVSAMAVGTALAVHDYVRTERREWTVWELAELDTAAAEIEAVRLLTYRAAIEVDADRQRGYHASMAKTAAVALAKRVTTRLPRLLGRGALLEHPLLEKWWRDASAFEFMEGTSHIQRLHVAQGYLKGEAHHVR